MYFYYLRKVVFPAMSGSGTNPFSEYNIAPFDVLQNAARVKCEGCGKSKRFWCGECAKLLLPDSQLIPESTVLPLKFEILQSLREKPQSSTAGQAACLAPGYVRVWRDEAKFKSQVLENADDSIGILYPCQKAKLLSELPNIQTLVLIDSPWTKSQVCDCLIVNN